MKLGIPVAHIEAGLRSFDRDDAGGAQPRPHRPPQRRPARPLGERGRRTSQREGIDAGVALRRQHDDRLAARARRDGARAAQPWSEFGVEPGGYGLVTLHRPALVDDPALLAAVADGLIALARRPARSSSRCTRARGAASRRPASTRGCATRACSLTEPLGYLDFLGLEAEAALRRSPTPAACRRRRRRSASAASRCATRPSGRDGRARHEHRARRDARSGIAEIPQLLERPKPGEADPALGRRRGRRAAAVLLPRSRESRRRLRARGARLMCGIVGVLRFDGTASASPSRTSRRMRETIVHRGPDGARHLGRRRRPRRPRLPPARDHRPLRRGDAADGERGRLDPARLQRRDLQPRRDPRRARGARRPPLADRPLRHRGDRPRLRGVGHRLPPPLPRHVRARDLGRARAASSGSSATASASSRSTTASTTAGSSFASEIKALLPGSRAGARGRRGGALPLPLVPDDAGAANAVRGIRKLPGGTWMRVTADGAIREQRYWDRLGHAEPLDRRARERDRRAGPRRAADLGAAPQGQRRPGRRLPLRRHRLEHERRALLRGRATSRSRRSRSATRASTRATRTSSTTRGRWPSASAPSTTSGCSRVDDLLDFLPTMVQLQDEPIADPVCVPVYYVSKLARDNGVIVAQVGEGADELFWGYPGLEGLPQPAARRRPAGAVACSKRAGVAAATRIGKGERREVEFLRRGADGQPVFWGGAEAFTADAEAAPALDRGCAASSTGSPRGTRSSRSAQRFEEQAWERSPLALDDLPRPEPAAARAAADARRQDEHGRQPRGARAVPRPQVRRARALASREREDARTAS